MFFFSNFSDFDEWNAKRPNLDFLLEKDAVV